MKNTTVTLLFGLALLLAILTRFYLLGQAPNGLYLDEAGQGYNAYSILKTGKDEFGKSFPIVFRSFTDFKTPVYVYLIVPLIPIFGLTKFAVRFPSFFFSILTFPILYLLIKKIAPKKYAISLSLLTNLVLAISPWHILFGRTNFECNVALFFFLSGIYFFYKGLEKPKNLLFSAILFAIAIPAYHAQRVVTPLTMIVLFVRHKKTLLSQKHICFLVVGSILGFLILLPTLSVIKTPGFLARATGLNIFSTHNQLPNGTINDVFDTFSPIINNKFYLSTKEFASLYASYFSPLNMFSLGDYGPRSSYPELGTFFIWQLPLYLIGLYKIIKDRGLKELRFLTLSLLFISPIPAAVTRDPYSSIRSLQMVIPLSIIISLGLIEFWKILKSKLLKNIAIAAFSLLIIYSLGKLFSSAIILNEYYRAREWDYGWEEVAQSIAKLDQNLPIIVDTARQGPHIELLFFLKYDPVEYQKNNFEVTTEEYYTKMSRRSTWDLGNIKIQPINWKNDLAKKQYLIGDRLAISDEQIEEHNLTLIKDIFYPDGVVAFRIVETNPD